MCMPNAKQYIYIYIYAAMRIHDSYSLMNTVAYREDATVITVHCGDTGGQKTEPQRKDAIFDRG